MSHTTDLPTAVPNPITSGETVEWEKEFDDFPADEWTVTYYFRGAGAGLDAAGTPDGTAHIFTLAASATANLTAGRYDYQAVAVNGSEKHLVDEGIVTVKASLAALTTATTYDGRSTAKKILDAIDALMQGKAALDQQKYLIATGVPGFTSQREAERIQPTELLELRKYYAALVVAENRNNKTTAFSTIKVHFNPPSR